MKRPTQHAAKRGINYVERDPGDYTGRHRLIEGGHNGQFYMGCPSCVYGAKS